ncbi:MAG TPA: glycine cleavage system protein GcvH [Elusimicrobia bacterium]|nr:glycine cleavage system protein GcvH [Elusimicrobiota bacterium]
MANPESCRFAKSHEWIVAEGDAAVVGLSNHAQKEITDVVFVELPKVGRKLKQGEAAAVIESVKAAFDFYAPVSGEVTAVNPDLPGNPALVNQSPHEKGWFFKIKPSSEAEMNSLMDFAAYQEFLKTAAH